jgi:hypothetical protein
VARRSGLDAAARIRSRRASAPPAAR